MSHVEPRVASTNGPKGTNMFELRERGMVIAGPAVGRSVSNSSGRRYSAKSVRVPKNSGVARGAVT